MPLAGGPLVAKITKDSREDEMEENMQQVNSMIGNLKNMAMDMGQEIRAQNAQMKKMAGEAGRLLSSDLYSKLPFLDHPTSSTQHFLSLPFLPFFLFPPQTSVKRESARRTKDRPNSYATDHGVRHRSVYQCNVRQHIVRLEQPI